MNVLFFLIPITFCLGLVGLGAFIWNLRNGQYEDLSGAAERVLIEAAGATGRSASAPSDVPAAPLRAKEREGGWSQI